VSTAVINGECTGCGRDVCRDVSGLEGWLRDMAAHLPLVCDACIAENEQRESAREQLRERRVVEQRRGARLRASGIPTALAILTWADIDRAGRADAIDAAMRWTRGELAGLLLTGPVGVGKTRIAAAAATGALTHRALRWTSAPVLMARLGSGLGTTEREEVIDVLLGKHALVLDDLDKARPTEYAAEQLFAAIDTRLTNELPLLITTNLGSDQLSRKWPEPYGHAITSRLVGYCEAYRITGSDRRLSRVAA
jgi:DNA replication protein DnaC